MARQYRFFTIPVKDSREAEAEMNRFLGSHRITHIRRELIANGENSFWCVSVEYDSASKAFVKTFGAKIDYRDVLSQEDFAVFTKMRDWRKEAAKKENVRPYVIFTDAQIAKIAEKRPADKSGLLEIDGIGEGRLAKYGDDIISILSGAESKEEEKR